MKLRAACVVLGFLSLAQLTFAQSTTGTASALPRLVRFGGTVKDLNGNPMTGVVGITFALYSEQTGGAALWLETQNVTADGNGRYVAVLGSTKLEGVPAELFISEQAHWVGVQVSGQAEQPRVLLVSAPYAFKAGDAETLGGRPASAYTLNFQQSDTEATSSNSTAPGSRSQAIVAAISGSGTTNFIPRWTSSTKLGNSAIFQSTAGDLGIGTSAPAYTVDISGSSGIRASASGTATQAVYGISTATTGDSVGVLGQADSSGGVGGLFRNTANGPMLIAGNGTRTIVSVSGTPTATWNGVVLSVSGEGVGASDGSCTPTGGGLSVCAYGVGLASTTGLGPAIYAVAGDGAGVQGTGGGAVDNIGVSGTGTGAYSVGVIGGLATGASGIGVQGMASVGEGSLAGDFEGDVSVSGTLSKSAGSFKIDHPLDPANKYLSHSFVESPDMMNIYNGNAVLDEKGEVWVSLPAWFEVLNRDFRYQLTCVGGFAPIYISEEINGNRFKIAGGKPGLKVSWQVTGIRQDAYAKARPIVVEQMKPPSEKGFYVFPEGFGQPQSKAIAERYRAKLARLKEMAHRSNEAAPKSP